MSDLNELRRQLRIAYGKVIADYRAELYNQSQFAGMVQLSLNTFRRIEMGERPVTAPELDTIAMMLQIDVDVIAEEARALVAEGKIPSHQQRAADSWRNFFSPKKHD